MGFTEKKIIITFFKNHTAVKGSGEYSFLDGSKYVGEWEEINSIKLRHGTGTFINGPESYVGEWSNDFMSGHGEYIFCSGLIEFLEHAAKFNSI